MRAVVRTCYPFYDEKERADRMVGDEFEADEGRIEEINTAGFGKLVEIVREIVQEEPKPTAKKRQ